MSTYLQHHNEVWICVARINENSAGSGREGRERRGGISEGSSYKMCSTDIFHHEKSFFGMVNQTKFQFCVTREVLVGVSLPGFNFYLLLLAVASLFSSYVVSVFRL